MDVHTQPEDPGYKSGATVYSDANSERWRL